MDKLKQFLAKYSGATHAIGAVWLLLSGAYAGSDAFRSAVNSTAVQIYDSLPHGLAAIVTAASGIIVPLWAFYRKGNPPSSGSSTQGLGGVASAIVVSLMTAGLLFSSTIGLTGCTQAQRISVAQEIVNWTPTFVSGIDAAGAAISPLTAADPVAAVVLTTFVNGANVLAPQFETAAKNYLANPTQSTLAVLQGLIVQIQNATNTALLDAAHITNPVSQTAVTKWVNAVAVAANALLSLIQSISTQTQVSAMSQGVTVHLREVRGVLDQGAMQDASNRVTQDLGMGMHISVKAYLDHEQVAGF